MFNVGDRVIIVSAYRYGQKGVIHKEKTGWQEPVFDVLTADGKLNAFYGRSLTLVNDSHEMEFDI